MGHTVAVLSLHGIGRTKPGYSAPLVRALTKRLARRLGAEAGRHNPAVVFEEVNWSAALQAAENRLWKRLRPAAPLHYERLRHFMLDSAADAIAYQPIHSDRSAYDSIHAEVAASLGRLAARAGEAAPLCVIAHSLGTVIASNYLYDLMKKRCSFLAPRVNASIGGTPIERGETLALLYTMGSPIALWSLRYPDFGVPICFPPHELARHHPGVQARWINLYDPDDVIGYPLRPLNARYAAAVTEDRPVNVGSWLTSWNPLAHTGYWGDGRVADLISIDIADTWRRSRSLAVVRSPVGARRKLARGTRIAGSRSARER
jgi:hypothetical protein